MDIVESCIRYFKMNTTDRNENSLTSTCTLFWGRQNYDGKIRDLLKDRQIDFNNHRYCYAFIQQFVKVNITGFKLKKAITAGRKS